MKSRKHYKNRGFGDTEPPGEGKNPSFRDMSLCASAKREIFAQKTHYFWLRGSATCFSLALPETTIFIVVSGTHTWVLLAHVPETTIKIVVSGDMR